MTSSDLKIWRRAALLLAAIAVMAAVAGCGSSSGSSSASTAPAETEAETAAATEAEPEEGSPAELEEIMLIQIFGKFGGNKHEYEIPDGGSCSIVKINTTPAAVKAGGEAVMDHEGNASVQVKPKGGGGRKATMTECREALEEAIG
jgi:ABC-type glycerol-3-phosphate transport system substrate-binding protein